MAHLLLVFLSHFLPVLGEPRPPRAVQVISHSPASRTTPGLPLKASEAKSSRPVLGIFLFLFLGNGSRREKVVKGDSNFPNYVEILLKGFIRGKVATAN